MECTPAEIRAPVAEIGKIPVNHVTVELKANDFVGSSPTNILPIERKISVSFADRVGIPLGKQDPFAEELWNIGLFLYDMQIRPA